MILRCVIALRSNPEILDALRLRIAQVSGRAGDREATLETFGMNKLFGRDDAK